MSNSDGTTRVVHCRKERYDIYIGRPGRWGNPYSHLPNTTAQFRVSTRAEAIRKYREYILSSPQLLADVKSLKGKVLGCWCKPLSCHGDILKELSEMSVLDSFNQALEAVAEAEKKGVSSERLKALREIAEQAAEHAAKEQANRAR